MTRCRVLVGEPGSARGILGDIEKAVGSDEVRLQVLDYLTERGVALGTANPPGWFWWLDAHVLGALANRFAARCGDPPGVDGERDAASRYWVFAQVIDRSQLVWRAVGYAFLDEDRMRALGHAYRGPF